MATITLHDMQFFAHHGCFEMERKVGTYFTVSITYTYDDSLAAQNDDITQTVNYLSVYQVVKREMNISSNLIEHVALRIKNALLGEFPLIETISVRLCKLNPPLGGQVEKVCVSI